VGPGERVAAEGECLPEFAAERTKIRMQPLKMAGRVGMPLSWMATTNGEAAAEVDLVPASASAFESYGTIIPSRKTSTT
jgi:hypothetical protein